MTCIVYCNNIVVVARRAFNIIIMVAACVRITK